MCFHGNLSPTGVSRQSGGGSQVSSSSLLRVDDSPQRPRLNSSYVRELIRGKFIIKSEDITQLENIGQGGDIILIQ